jgi:hypothetical protein
MWRGGTDETEFAVFGHMMKMAADLRGWWRHKREDLAFQRQRFMIPSPIEVDKDVTKLSIAEEKAARAKQCTDGM